MMTKKRNMLPKTVAFLFLVTRDDVSQNRQTSSYFNEHYNGLWRMIQREFNMEQLIRIVQKSIIRIMYIFKIGLGTSRIKTSFLGYQQNFSDLISSSEASDGA